MLVVVCVFIEFDVMARPELYTGFEKLKEVSTRYSFVYLSCSYETVAVAVLSQCRGIGVRW
jgi:hypothetical protein